MTRERILTSVAAILTTLLETDGSPESMIYIGLGMDLSAWQQIKGILLSSELITCHGYYVELTEAGRETAEQCNAVLAQR